MYFQIASWKDLTYIYISIRNIQGSRYSTLDLIFKNDHWPCAVMILHVSFLVNTMKEAVNKINLQHVLIQAFLFLVLYPKLWSVFAFLNSMLTADVSCPTSSGW